MEAAEAPVPTIDRDFLEAFLERAALPLELRFEEERATYAAYRADQASRASPRLEDRRGRRGALFLDGRRLAEAAVAEAEGGPAVELSNPAIAADPASIEEAALGARLGLRAELGAAPLSLEETARLAAGDLVDLGAISEAAASLVLEGTGLRVGRGETLIVDDRMGFRLAGKLALEPLGPAAGAGLVGRSRAAPGSSIEARLVFGRASLTLRELASLGEGALVELDSAAAEPFALELGGGIALPARTLFLGDRLCARLIPTEAPALAAGAEGDGATPPAEASVGAGARADAEAAGDDRPFAAARAAAPADLAACLAEEGPQLVALVLSFLDADKAAYVLGRRSVAERVEITRRVALLRAPAEPVLRAAEAAVAAGLAALPPAELRSPGGLDAAAAILNGLGGIEEGRVVSTLKDTDPDLAEELRKRLFVFEDLVLLDDRALQMILRELDSRDLLLALRGASGEVQEKVFRNLSKRAADLLKEDLSYCGPVRLSEVEAAQGRIVALALRLEEAGEIVIVRGGETGAR